MGETRLKIINAEAHKEKKLKSFPVKNTHKTVCQKFITFTYTLFLPLKKGEGGEGLNTSIHEKTDLLPKK